jgi:flavorubredoxin
LIESESMATLPRTIAPGISWAGDCLTSRFQGSPIHIHHSVFLIHGGEQTLIVDTGRPSGFEPVLQQVEQVLDGRPLNWIAPTHPEVNHAANLERWMRLYPEAKLVGDLRDYHLFYPEFVDRFVMMDPGSVLDLGRGYGLRFLSSPIKDLASTSWLLEERRRVMFVADAFAYSHSFTTLADDDEVHATHSPGQCAMFAEELPQPINEAQVGFVLRSALYWTKFVDMGALFDQAMHGIDALDVNVIAPAHGNVITDLRATIPLLESAHSRIASRYEQLWEKG